MEDVVQPLQVRWADLDPNFHLRHSVYYDWGAMCRMEYFNKAGLTWRRMQQLQTGPVIFREECIFKKEIRLDDIITINLKITKAKKDFSRFSVQHEIKKEPSITAAVINVDIAWMNGLTRKLAVLTEEDIKILSQGPFAEGFQWLD